MRTLLFDCALLPEGWAEGVAVSVDFAGDITAVSVGGEVTAGERVPGCALPGIPNLHCHAHQRAMAGLAERSGSGNDSFWTWREAMYRYLGAMQPHQLEAVAAQVYVEMLKAGYTSVAEFQYLHHDPAGQRYGDVAEMSLRTLLASEQVGIGMTCLPVLYRYGGLGGQSPVEGQRRFIADAETFLDLHRSLEIVCDGNPSSVVGAAPHSLRAVTRELLDEVLSGVGGTGPVHIHVAEQEREVADCLAWSGKRPVEWLLDNTNVDERWCLIHATHMSDEETAAVAGTGAVVGLCPTTEANLGDGLFDAVSFQSRAGRYGIGSDSNISVSPVEELRWLEYGQRLRHQRRNVLAGGAGRSTGRALLERVLAGGAQACGRDIGRIAVGARADFIILDTEHPTFHGRSGDELLDCWIFSGSGNRVRDVFVGGRQVVADEVHVREREVEERFRQSLDELAG